MLNLRKRLAAFFVAFLFLLCLPLTTGALDIDAEAYILLDMKSGEVFASKNTDEVLYMASITKVMTALVVLNNIENIDATVNIPKTFMNVGESSAGILPGETHSYRDLLYGLMLKSANDTAQCLAIGVAGTEALFVEMMNKTAALLGMNNTHFMNPHGLHNNNHYTTINDWVKVTKAALQYEVFREIAATPQITLPWNDGEISFTSTNKLFGTYEGIKGIKTGYTSQAGNCLVALCERDGMELLGVMFKANNVCEQMSLLLDYGFNNYHYETIYEEGEYLNTLPVKDGKQDKVDICIKQSCSALMKNTPYIVKSDMNLPDFLVAPVQAGEVVGQVKVTDSFGNVYELEAVTTTNVELYTFSKIFKETFKTIFSVLTGKK